MHVEYPWYHWRECKPCGTWNRSHMQCNATVQETCWEIVASANCAGPSAVKQVTTEWRSQSQESKHQQVETKRCKCDALRRATAGSTKRLHMKPVAIHFYRDNESLEPSMHCAWSVSVYALAGTTLMEHQIHLIPEWSSRASYLTVCIHIRYQSTTVSENDVWQQDKHS